ncbi:MAG: endopeptidase La [Gemmatales bacterium]|nr:endopeptidase La [Gemmatales bacterium]MDW8386469.1 endopeptidase La [Gemmatales bacterium]
MTDQPVPALQNPETLPVLPIKNTVLFPYLFLPLSIGRPASVAAVEAALATEEKTFVVVAQRDQQQEHLSETDIYTIGTKAMAKKMARRDGHLEILVQGIERVVIVKVVQTEPYLKAKVQTLPLPDDTGTEVEALTRSIVELATKALTLANPESPVDIQGLASQAKQPLQLAYLLGSMLSLSVPQEQALLEAPTQLEALRLLHGYLTHEVQVLEIRQQIASQAQTAMSQEQRQYYLRQQMEAIRKELGETTPERAEVETLRERLHQADIPDEVRKEAERELSRLERTPPMAPDFQVTRTYLELILELPWKKETEDNLDLHHARQILDKDHYDLEDVKERILEHLAVLKLNPKANAPILCFVGPPGVGKTSLGQSIARALGRKFERLSLGGLHDEAELRGHRRTYIGAMPGRIIQALRRAGVRNPLLMLDEVDKLGESHYRGDPAAALLEILDPAQNHTFRDNYLDLPFDLSRVFFITTANTLHAIPTPLLDRMEVLRLSGYTQEEKEHIARRFLIPRQLANAGLTPEQLVIPDETLRAVIRRYTREAGVRELDRMLGSLVRKVALLRVEKQVEHVTITPDQLPEMLGPERFFEEKTRTTLEPGVATGLAWTEAGGEVLYVEALVIWGVSGLELTGQLGRVMKESAQAALSYVRSHAAEFGIPMKLFKRCGIHIHVPKGAVPKDGPSAGVAIVTALASVLTGRPARADTAMTGEITLTGLVLPVGGIKEKVLAAHRAGIRRVVLPKANQGDLVKLPDQVRKDIEIVLVENISEALKETLTDQPVRVPTMDQMEDGEAPKESVESARQAAAPASAQQPPA